MRPPEDQKPIDRQKILETALRYVMNDRELDYGGPEDSFSVIARFWSAYLESRPNPDAMVDAYDVGVMMVLFKVARMVKRPSKIDSCIDAAGYSACAGEILERMNFVGKWVPSASMPEADTGLQPLRTEHASESPIPEPPVQRAPVTTSASPSAQQDAPEDLTPMAPNSFLRQRATAESVRVPSNPVPPTTVPGAATRVAPPETNSHGSKKPPDQSMLANLDWDPEERS